MNFEVEVVIIGCNVFILIKPESKEAEVGKVISSVLRWGSINIDEVNTVGMPLMMRLLLNNAVEAYGGSLSLDNDEFRGALLIGERGNVVLSGEFKQCKGELQSTVINDLSNKLINMLMSIYGNVTSTIYVYRFVERLNIEASTLPQEVTK